jgi:hypothetical protein
MGPGIDKLTTLDIPGGVTKITRYQCLPPPSPFISPPNVRKSSLTHRPISRILQLAANAGSTPYLTRSKEDVSYPGRWEFIGEHAALAIRNKYIGKSVAHYFKKGAANPITYVNM